MSGFTYPEVGATRGGDLPPGYRHLRHRSPLPAGAFEAAGEAVLTWRLHRAAGMRVTATAGRAAPGVRVTSRLAGLVVAPCEVVWTIDDDERTGFAYGTLPGHPASGEESFIVARTPDGGAELVITSFSRPANRLMRLTGPLAPAFQRTWAAWLGRTLRGLTAA
ncbi:MAG TPA: DUF1990 domain-containing protein [Asanoa sp.]